MSTFPVHRLRDKTDRHFQLKAFDPGESGEKKSEELGVHRDDHYIFILLTKGSGSMTVDFEEKTIRQGELYYILPEQVHYRISTNNASGWFIGIDPSLVGPEYHLVFESWLGFQAPLALSGAALEDYRQLLTLLCRRQVNDRKDASNYKVLQALLLSFVAMAADSFRGYQQSHDGDSRAVELTTRFRKLLNQHFRAHKNPSAYARMLHISEPYLNEAVKKVTGAPLTFWIKQEVLTEAKRMLYFSELNVKQIADALGYENYSYFCRLFRQEAGMPPLLFRKKFRMAT